MKGEFNFKRYITAVMITIMIIFEGSIVFSAVRNMKASEKIILETEAPDEYEEAEALKAKYKDKANNQFCLALLCGILFTGMGAILVECVQT